jgi:hypothetical protein
VEGKAERRKKKIHSDSEPVHVILDLINAIIAIYDAYSTGLCGTLVLHVANHGGRGSVLSGLSDRVGGALYVCMCV